MALAYRFHVICGYGYECPTEITEVLIRAIPSTPGMVLYVPYITQPWNIGYTSRLEHKREKKGRKKKWEKWGGETIAGFEPATDEYEHYVSTCCTTVRLSLSSIQTRF